MNFTIDRLRLDVDGRRWDVDVAGSITDAEVELTIEGASVLTITVEDPELRLLASETLSRWVWGETAGGTEGAWVRKGEVVDAELDGIPLRLVKLAKTGTSLTLTFEDRDIARLRRRRGARKMNRQRVTRAEFIAALVREVRSPPIRLYSPEMHRRLPIASSARRVRRETRESEGRPGINTAARLTVKGAPATPSQLAIAERLLDVADSLDAPPRATLALIEAGIIESVLSNPRSASADGYGSYGVLQARVGVSNGVRGTITMEQALDVEYMARCFLTGPGFASKGSAIRLAREHPSWTAGQIAQQVEMSAFPDRYDQVRDEAQAIINAYDGGGSGVRYRTWQVKKRYEFARGRDENTWDAAGRLVDEIGWRRFFRGRGEDRRLWLVSDEFLFRQRPALIVREGEGGVDWLDFELDTGARRPVAEVTAQVRADRWLAWPGMLVEVADAGPVSGRWLVTSVRQSLVDRAGTAEIMLRKPIPERNEPANDVETRRRRIGGGALRGGVLLGGGDGSAVDRVYAMAAWITRRQLPYGPGGHGAPWKSARYASTMDCSSSTSVALHAGGMMDNVSGPQVSDWFLSWGAPGKGRTMTVWVHPGTGMNGHVWIEFYGRRAKRFDTSSYGSGGSGPELRYTDRSKAGFIPRHWPGT